MTKQNKKTVLKAAKILIGQCTEHIPPEVKSSNINYNVAKCLVSIDALINALNK